MGAAMLFTFSLSLQGMQGAGELGFDNYRSIMSSTRFWNALRNTFYFGALALILETVLGVGIALLLDRPFRGRSVMRALFLLPMLATPTAISLIWRLMYHPSLGIFSQLLSTIPGVEGQTWLANPGTVIPALVVADAWQWTPFMVLITLTALTALPREPLEAALIDGANNWQRIRFIKLPLIKSVLFSAIAFRAVDAFRTFDIIFVITGGGPGRASETLNIYAYLETFLYGRENLAAAVVSVLVMILLVLSFVINKARVNA